MTKVAKTAIRQRRKIEPDKKGGCVLRDKKNKQRKPLKSRMSVARARSCVTQQNILRGAPTSMINMLVKEGNVVRYQKGAIVVEQDAAGESAFFILEGTLEVLVNGRQVGERRAKECVGEMSILDPTQRRCATLRAGSEVHLLRVDASVMKRLLKNVTVLRQVACELCARLREREKFHARPNNEPKVFIGSSSEGLSAAKSIRDKFAEDGVDVKLWNEGVFEPSENGIEALLTQTQKCDFAVLILTPDDQIKSRNEPAKTPRDNVVFESGLFMGAIGRERTYLLTAEDRMKLPSDLDGVTKVYWNRRGKGAKSLDEAYRKIKKAMDGKGVK